MNKNFENEYKNMILTDIPDLWDRIEAGLPEQNGQEQKQTNQEHAKTTPQKENISYIDSTTKKRRTHNNVRYGGWIAAAICLAIVIPAVMVGARVGRLGQHSESAMDDRNAMEADGAHEAENSVDEAPAYVEQSVAETDSFEASQKQDTEAIGAMNESEAVLTGTGPLKELIISNVQVVIQSVTVTQQGEAITYEAVVEQSRWENLPVGSVIELRASTGNEIEGVSQTELLQTDALYELNLYPMEDDTKAYLIIGVD